MKVISQPWNFMRVLRLVLGLAILIQGVMISDVFSIVLGVAFGGMAIANIGCCGVSACQVKTQPDNKNTQDVVFEEVTQKKNIL